MTIKNHVKANENIQFLHYAKNEQTGKNERALYELEPNASKFNVTLLPELAGICCFRIEERGEYFWLEGLGMSLYRFSMKTREVVDYSKIILQQHPDLSYFGAIINSTFEDRTGVFWVSIHNNWMLKITNSQNPFARYLGERRENSFCKDKTCVIRGITSDDQGNIYFAYDYGIYTINQKTGKEYPLEFKPTFFRLQEAYSLTITMGNYTNDLETP